MFGAVVCALSISLLASGVSSFAVTCSVSSRSPVLGSPSTLAARAVAPTLSYLESLSIPNKSEPDEKSGDGQARKLELLDDALRLNSTAASELLSQFNQLRERGASQEDMEKFANDLLLAVDEPIDSDGISKERSFPWWTRIRPMARFSRRARLASLQRVLDISTPSVDEKESLGDDVDADKRRRRRSLIVLIRALASTEIDDEEEGDSAPSEKTAKRGRTPAIVMLEKAARKDLKSTIKSEDIESRLPPGLETPDYTVLVRRKAYEIRRYEPFSVCSVPMNRPRPTDSSKTDAKISNPQLAGAGSFGALAGYLFGKNQQSTAMKMTTPVLSEGEGDEKSMSFVLPSVFWKEDGLEMAPQPLEGSGVQLKRSDGGERAVLMFGGFASKKDVETRKAQLLESLAADKDWMAESGSSVTLAQYNDPFTPPWKRRNEVSVNVLPKT